MFKEVAKLIKEGSVVAFTGAGISCESGIPAFRGEDGLWKKYDPEIYATVDGLVSLFKNDIKNLKNFIIENFNILIKAEPNFSHFALSSLEEKGYLIGVITQNIDNLHIEAGTKNITEIHGNIYNFLCPKCWYSIKRKKEEVKEFIKNLSDCNKKIVIKKYILEFLGRCPKCRIILRSGVVLFGQELPERELNRSYEFLDKAKTLICIGTSGNVYPAAHIPFYAYDRKIKIINVNIDSSSIDRISDFIFREKASIFFKKLFSYL